MSETAATEQNPPANNELRTVVGNRVDFSASLETFQGPLDLLLYLIKENEVEITEIPVSKILQQYLHFTEQATQWDLQLAGEFLVMAATLMEIKSRELLPVQELEGEDQEEIIEDPRSELVRQLLAYRQLKDKAKLLEDLQEQWQRCRARGMFGDVPEVSGAEAEEQERDAARGALIDVDLFALYAAYERVLKAVLAQNPRNILFDEETLEDKVKRIEATLKERPFARFAELIRDPSNRGDIAATFVALLELVRRRAVRLMQGSDFGSLEIKAQTESEADEITRQESAEAEADENEALRQKAEAAAAAEEAGAAVAKLPWQGKRLPARPKFQGLVRPEDVEEIDAEEQEIGRRIDAILAAADAISERFEQSREGKIRDENAPPEDGALPQNPDQQKASEAPQAPEKPV